MSNQNLKIKTLDEIISICSNLNQRDSKGVSGFTAEYKTPDKNGYVYTVVIYWNDLFETWCHGPKEGTIIHHIRYGLGREPYSVFVEYINQ